MLRLAALLLTLPLLATALTGDHVCHRVENYTVTLKEQYVEPVEIHTLVWCLQIPPRCSQKRTELRERWRTKMEVKFKSVPVCCEGYVIQEPVGNGSADAKCVPHCKKCRSGVCSAPNECTCDPGFQGQDCASECPQGTWGRNCERECNCLRKLACDPVAGKCECQAGWTGPRCENKCPEGQWGLGCKSLCLCENPSAGCHHETGECSLVDPSNVGVGEGFNNVAPIDPFEASGISGNLVSKTAADADYVDIIDFDKEAILSRVTENESETMAVLEEQRPILSSSSSNSSPLSTKTIEQQPTVRSTSPLPRATLHIEGNQLSQPDDDDEVDDTENMLMTKKKNGEFEFGERHTNFRVSVSPKNDYVKNTHKGESSASMSTISIDVAAMIVVGAIVLIGLTSVAALMIFHVRSRLFKAALAIYSQEKVERQLGNDKDPATTGGANAGKSLDVTIGTLPRTMTKINPVYEANPVYDANILTFDERPAEYANGTVTIGIRLSSNLRDLLESHYDRPAACSQRTAALATGEPDVEHVYDEIPLSAPFYFAKDT
ncbi:uncharacterized protein LOC131664288 [Phymastichus coffea]|uniref:uncharacterized protein LOC131664288 n=1 Tax=Phymastichus coffea TaxID=108790 RepID=UPI00273AB9EF|nr:uncharacterized protein LOC131664288 [Phymastichus coffea]XP_058791246.1 uncharacterized protein LOC131664288 [Phymastichus coffea]XP_058791247.1 uncharacterized protein LOC131664288 [Phymastichus coffea]